MENADVVMIGAGVVGLAIAERLTQAGRSVYLVERHSSFEFFLKFVAKMKELSFLW